MDFEVGSSVRILTIDRNWNQYTTSMDKYLGEWAEVKDYDSEIGYLLELGTGDELWFNSDWLTDSEDEEAEEEVIPKVQQAPQQPIDFNAFEAIKVAGAANNYNFYISNKSNRIYRHLINGIKWGVYEDKDGNIVTSEYFSFRRAPAECKNFDWVVPVATE